MKANLTRARRAMLYVPGSDERKLAKAAGLEVDTIVLDLEDGVAFNRKDEARLVIRRVLGEVDFGRSERFVRINPLNGGRAEEDLQAVLAGKPDGILVPKVDTVEIVVEVDRLISDAEKWHGLEPGSICIAVTIESAKAFLNLREICQASRRLQVMVFGAEDFTADTGITRTPGAQELLYARGALVMHGTAFGLQVIDMVQTNYSNLQLLEEECQRGAEMGFTGKQVIHPNQVEIVQTAFTPNEKTIEYARRVIEGARDAQQDGRGAFTLEGQMVDLPVVKRAENILRRAKAAGVDLELN